ncbi:unnamed protein product [Symbiodinium natans]|uniref:Uncharacterized protein n=1 Tax=Symbiodinium natans TaxID=878477 RepID=A0A812PQD0_9DINO|nr:unnamed protein product [Symbiodinium natans]
MAKLRFKWSPPFPNLMCTPPAVPLAVGGFRALPAPGRANAFAQPRPSQEPVQVLAGAVSENLHPLFWHVRGTAQYHTQPARRDGRDAQTAFAGRWDGRPVRLLS